MKSDEYNGVDQAVFGYSNGHRLLTSSMTLSAVDVYELAAASDLAPGAQISGNESYLTGLMLPDSKMYALIRTWLAPEMPRPGCVWSHVLLLDRKFLSTHIDLAALNKMFRRPDNHAGDEAYSVPLAVSRRSRGERCDPGSAEKVLWACYSDLPIKDDPLARGEVEGAILAVWSQQWPRLRARFVFRSIPSATSLKGQIFDFRGGVSLVKTNPQPAWISEALRDVTSETVTPLRRFLWRYGKDMNADKRVLPDLTRLYLATRSKQSLSFDVANEVLQRYQFGQADTLKRDVLGLSLSKLSLIPSVGSVDLMRLLVEHNDNTFKFDEKELVSLFSDIEPDHLPETAGALFEFKDPLGDLFHLILQAILPAVSKETLSAGQLPYAFVRVAVFADTSLLDDDTARSLSTDDLLALWGNELDNKQRGSILQVLLERENVSDGSQLLNGYAREMFETGILLVRQSRLHDSWLFTFRSNVDLFLDQLSGLEDARDLMAAGRLLGFPAEPEATVRSWYSAFKNVRSSLSQDDETRCLVYLLALCVRHSFQNYRDILIVILAPLRDRVLSSDLPSDAEEMLTRWLPSDDSRWDLNKRLLKLFRKAYKRGVNMDDVVDSLNLSDGDYAYATDQDPDNAVRRLFRVLNPWGYFD